MRGLLWCLWIALLLLCDIMTFSQRLHAIIVFKRVYRKDISVIIIVLLNVVAKACLLDRLGSRIRSSLTLDVTMLMKRVPIEIKESCTG